MGVERRRVRFSDGRGSTLAGRLDLSENGAPWAYAVVAHCFTCTKDLKALYHLGGALALAGIGALRLDFGGLGESEGDFAQTSLAANAADLAAAGRFLWAEGRPPELLVGHSLGGAAALLAAAEMPSVRAVAVIATSADPGHLSSLLPEAREKAREGRRVAVQLGPQTFELEPKFFRDLESADVAGAARGLGRPLLVVHSQADAVVPLAHGEDLFRQARHPKAFVSLGTADHLLSRAEDASRVGRLIAAWAKLHLED
ncbi:MAG: alpha/beta hydrolase [Proteobacteria bacterium]|nr:alpha/beta hydrolase [Pseudomonadota bacterium]